MSVKTDCCNYDPKSRDCRALDALYCSRKRCKFYKTNAENEAQLKRCEERLEQIAVGNIKSLPQSIGWVKGQATAKKYHVIDEKTGKAKRVDDRDRSDYRKKRMEDLIAQGKCPMCGKQNDRPGKTRCSACLEKFNAYRKARAIFLGEEE